MQVQINGNNRTDRILWTTLRIENVLTKQVDRCLFTIRNPSTDLYRPVVGQQIIILDDDGITRIFGGVIVRLVDKSPTFGIVEYEVECQDFSKLLDQKLVAATYEGMTVAEIIEDLLADYTTGFTDSQVDCDTTISKIQFKYEPVSACIAQLAELTGYDWYVDYYKDVYFKSPSASAAPVDVTDSNGTYDDGSLVIRSDNSQLRTSIIVRGGDYLGTEFTSSMRADGKQTIFNLPYKYTDFKATLTGNPLSIGIDYIDDADDYHALHNFQEKALKFKEADRPSVNATLSFSGKPNLPVIVKYRDPVAVAAAQLAMGTGDGRFEYVVIDKAITSQTAARERAAAEIRTYGETLSEGSFDTETAGLKAGQRIRIQSTSRDIDEYFVINKVITEMKTPTTFRYKISLITTKTMDYLSVMKKLILRDNKTIDLRDNEQLDLVESVTDTITLDDSTFTAQSLNWPVEFVLGPQAHSGFKRPFVIGGSRLGA